MVKQAVSVRWPILGMAAIIIVALVGTLVATQLLAHGGDSEKVHTCVNDSSGIIRVVGPDDGCRNNETPVGLSTKGGAADVDITTFCTLVHRIVDAGLDIDVSEPCTVFDITTVDSAGTVGFYSSMAIGTDGFPVISYADLGNGDLKVAHCTDPVCTSAADITTVDSAGFVGFYTSIVIGTDGFPVISYFDGFPNNDLKVAHCTDLACASPADITTVDSIGGFTNAYTSIAIGTDGFPVISHWDFGSGDLKVAHCTDLACTSTADITTVDSAGFVGLYTSLAIGTDGFPVISYFDSGNEDLSVAHCNDLGCTGTTDITTLSSPEFVGGTSLAIGTDGFPVISYTQCIGSGALKPESTEGRSWGQPLKKPEGAPLNLG